VSNLRVLFPVYGLYALEGFKALPQAVSMLRPWGVNVIICYDFVFVFVCLTGLILP